MFHEHKLWTIKVRFTMFIQHRDEYDEYTHTSEHPNTEETYSVVAETEAQVQAWLQDKFRVYPKANMEVLSISSERLHGCIINFMRM